MSIRTHQRRRLALVLSGVLLVLGLAAPAPAASAAPPTKPSLCWHRGWFGGTHYCPASTPGVMATTYGLGRRVYLDGMIVSTADQDSVSFVSPQHCDPQNANVCASSVYLTVPWTGPHRPKDDHSGPYTVISVRIYGTTTAGNLKPAGYVVTGGCYWEPLCGD